MHRQLRRFGTSICRKSLQLIPGAKNDKRVDVYIDHQPVYFSSLWLRDACQCSRCVDPSTTQKLFATGEIPRTIRPRLVNVEDDALKITWEWTERFKQHSSVYPYEFLKQYQNPHNIVNGRHEQLTYVPWDGRMITGSQMFVQYRDYMEDDKILYKVLKQLQDFGLVFVRNVPVHDENKVVSIAERIGNIKNTFYGPTFNVKSVPNAKNIAYTSLNLDLHMDLLYFESPPGLQLLHCLKNSVSGGSSVFADAFHAVDSVRSEDLLLYNALLTEKVTFRYVNDGKHYHFRRPTAVLEAGQDLPGTPNHTLSHVNYAPPFQGPFELVNKAKTQPRFPLLHRALKAFGEAASSPDAQFEYTLNEGDCAIFNNRRVLHGRRAFDTESGHRWLKGTYIDIDAYKSALRVFAKKFSTSPK